MKHLMILSAVICIGLVANAQWKKPVYTYKQKQLADSLQMLFPDLQNGDHTAVPKPATPVLPLSNEGTLVDITDKGMIYKMKPDNMLLLKPNDTNAGMPNAFSGKLMMVKPGEKKPD